MALDGSIDWWCPARFDAPSVFARLLDPAAGHWSIRPRAEYTVTRRYIEDTMVVETEFRTGDGLLRLTDALALGAGERGHHIGYGSPHVLLRHVEAARGEVEVDVELAARLEYGRIIPQSTPTPFGIEFVGGADRLTLTSDRHLGVQDGGIAGRFTLGEGESAMFALRHRHAADVATAPLDGRAALRGTVAGWRSWAALHQGYQGPYRAHVARSALVLQALTFQPTGAVIGAATTSLPEQIGGKANWDYRFGWLRDGSLTLKALWVAACPDEGRRFFEWIASSAGSLAKGPIPVMFGVAGEHDLSAHRLEHLAGYCDSRPVRVGNDAWKQKQLDVLGEVLECAWILRDQLGPLPPTTAALLSALTDRAAAAWQEPDAGIWEGREGERDYLTSKLMCWVALDRGIKLADRLGADASMDRWKAARQEVRTAILTRGWDDSVEAFTGAFGSGHLDAGVLLLPIVGFLPGDDERVVATLDAIEQDLSSDALVQRWTNTGNESAFVVCSYWLAAGRALAGQVDRAKEIFEAVTTHANDVGLLSEEIDRRDGALIGNFPQALSHIGLINAAWTIAQADTPGQ
ncbi:glycoside hydrolase family 15 protein [Spinactinospora alkalitolerans]